MRVAIVGGKLQGVEAAYLANKAGWQTVLIDRKATTPAAGLCDEIVQADIRQHGLVQDLASRVDLILPALEDQAGLAVLRALEKELDCPVAFDFAANELSSSKDRSHVFFDQLGLTRPQPYPHCGFPLLVKPEAASGSQGVNILADQEELKLFFGTSVLPVGWVGQQFVPGPSYSLEVIGRSGHYVTPQVTELHMDERFDCKAVTAPAMINVELADQLRRISLRLACALELNGIMDVEVIVRDDRLYLLEIDARLPSQTPMAVYWSSGVNMLQLLAELYQSGPHCRSLCSEARRWVRLEHIRVESAVLTLAGEHLMASGGPLGIEKDFFGVQEALTDYRPGKTTWHATLIHTGATEAELQARRWTALAAIQAGCAIKQVVDSGPVVPHSQVSCHDALANG